MTACMTTWLRDELTVVYSVLIQGIWPRVPTFPPLAVSLTPTLLVLDRSPSAGTAAVGFFIITAGPSRPLLYFGHCATVTDTAYITCYVCCATVPRTAKFYFFIIRCLLYMWNYFRFGRDRKVEWFSVKWACFFEVQSCHQYLRSAIDWIWFKQRILQFVTDVNLSTFSLTDNFSYRTK